MDEELLTAAEIARRAGVYRSTVGDWIRDGKITAAGSIKRGKGTQPLFRLKDAQPLIERTKGSAPEIV